MKTKELLKQFYHGSEIKLPVGTILVPSTDYAVRWYDNNFYQILEKYRPSDKLAHKLSVFMCDNPDDIDAAGGSTDWLFTVKPKGVVQRHDMNWGSKIDCLISDGYSEDSLEVKSAAKNYWDGTPSENEPLWEYLTPSAEITDCEVY
jgi:hypothetical protein